MELDATLQAAAAELGAQLGASACIQAYREAHARLLHDEQAHALDAEHTSLRERLIARQKAGEALTQTEVDSYHRLRMRAEDHALIRGRDLALAEVKSCFLETADVLTQRLHLDYAQLARMR